MNKLSEQIENVEKRVKKIDADMKRLLDEALAKKKQKDTRGNHPFPINYYRCPFRFEKKEDA